MTDDELKAVSAQLVEAVKAGALTRVQQLLTAGADPNFWAGVMGETPLHYAASAPIAAALLAAGADPDRKHFTITPLAAATLAGHDDVARLIYDYSARARAARISDQMRTLGMSYPSEAETELMIAGTEPVVDPQRLLEISRERNVEPDFPRTTFEGWIKQVDTDRIQPLAEAALQAGLPLFFDLNTPPEELLQVMSAAGAQRSGPVRRRTRRFAGDELLPRSRYYTLATDESGDDRGTLLREMWTYSHIARTGKIELIDTVDPAAPQRLQQLGIERPLASSILLVFLPGPQAGLSPFLTSNGLPQRVTAFPIPVRLTHERIENVVDLRLPDTADRFAKTVSQAVLQVAAPKLGGTAYLKCWPFRAPLETFQQLLPAMLTQELGGGVLSVAVGAMLRQAGVNGLVFPSARNDPYVHLKDGVVGISGGWNFVDYRAAPAPKQMVVLDVDRSWPDKVRLGPGFNLYDKPLPDLFRIVEIDYTDEGLRSGSFEVEGIVTAHNSIRQVEMEGFKNGAAIFSWWMA